ncbi:MAG: hypothetical protein QOE92_2159, partial [Chloroflexota bacterium]|nr:hypothetical protein [Chloroflexota bacterium]
AARRVMDHPGGEGPGAGVVTGDGDTIKVTTDANTKFVKGRGKRREPGSFADLEVGQRVAVAGDDTGPGTFAARVVHYPARGPRQG